MIARTAALTLAAFATIGSLAAPAEAQRRQRVVEVFGDDPAPQAQCDEIIVVARRPESDRYRIPTQFREATAADAVTQEARVDEMVALGRTGIDSCSSVGPGGFTGCLMRDAQNNRAARKAETRARENEPR